MYCTQCGNDVENASFCNKCGTANSNNEPQPQSEAPPPPEATETPPEAVETPPEAVETPPEAAEPPPEAEEPPITIEPPPPPIEAPPPPPMQVPPPPPPVGYSPAQQPPPPPPVGYSSSQQPPPPPHGHHPHQPPPHHYGYHQPAQPGFIGDVLAKTFGFVFKKPILLWGLSILCGLMSMLAIIFSIFPLIWMPILLVLQLGMVNIFLCGYRGQNISATQLFEGFTKGKFLRNAGGMGWRALWMLIWGWVPFVNIYKYYSYRFVPYIMLADPDIPATEALKKSMRQTNGYKGKMFGTDLLLGVCVAVATIIFIFIMRIPYIGILLFVIYYLFLVLFLPLIMGILDAVYYDKISKEHPVD